MVVAVQTTYPTTLTPGVEGMPGTMTTWDADTRTVETAAGIGFGKAVSQGATDKGVVIGGAAFRGVTYRDITLVHAAADVDKYLQRELAGVMVRGDVWVKVTGAVTPATPVTFAAATGNFGEAGTAVPNARYVRSAGAGGLTLLRVGMAP
jgi:hypothetical protein